MVMVIILSVLVDFVEVVFLVFWGICVYFYCVIMYFIVSYYYVLLENVVFDC